VTQTELALKNFDFRYRAVNLRLIYAMVTVKKAAALTYSKLGIAPEAYDKIAAACDEVLTGGHDDAFVTNALQGGAGTSAHMNVNEVLAALSGENWETVNRGQSTNDVYPTALRIAAIECLRELSQGCAELQESLQKKENAFEHIKKMGRTELVSAVPITLGMEFGAYAQAIARDRWRLYKMEERLRQVNLGGTMVGTAIAAPDERLPDDAAHRQYKARVLEVLRGITGIGIAAAEYPMDITQNNDVFVEVSGLLKALAVNLMKIANDLRLMNMLGEITLAPLQMGSSFKHDKVNPVIPEAVIQIAIKVIAGDGAITMAAVHGEFELNAFLPLIADALLENLTLLTDCATMFREKCVDLLRAPQIAQ
jgi:aspartate ammonia-lyase